jgi:ATP-binding cassette subfamily B protein
VVDGNGIVEQGTHQDLMAKRGVYNRLHDAQMRSH